MIIKFLDIEVTITLSTRKSRVLKDIREIGTLRAVKNYMDRYKCGLVPAYEFIKSVDAEDQTCLKH